MPSNKLMQVAAVPRDKPYKLGDGDGLYLLVNPNGSRWWRLKYHFEAREKLLERCSASNGRRWNSGTAYQVFISACRLLDCRCEIHGYTRRWRAP
jgi:hypothetical protein